ncbi:MAG: rRNA maturation RNase YbeY [Candidatus Magasanikbacteria bacterium]|nr:rRNA maturation RNase YbeY [Candidatus Magasanikbacteria bacterium]
MKKKLSEKKLEKKLQLASQLVLRKERKGKMHATIVFVTPKKIQSLNKIYRKKDSVTDVLSFREFDDDASYLGEIVVCRSQVRANAREYEVPYDEELVRMVIHSTLHLLDYDHMKPSDARVMLPLQEKYLSLFLNEYESAQ